MERNLRLAHSVIQKLLCAKVTQFVICAGSFNSPIVAILSQFSHIKLYHYFEERSAAFFALGLAKQSKHPVCICVTSGTAVAECLPAVIEAYYQARALVVLSADRESKLSATGYPQAIKQANLLSSHCEITIDVAEEKDLSSIPNEIFAPAHLNIRFHEPILDQAFSFEQLELAQPVLAQASLQTTFNSLKPKKHTVASFLKNFHRPLSHSRRPPFAHADKC